MSEQREDMTERDDLPSEVPAAADDAAGSVGAEESAAPTGKYGKLLSEEGGVRKLTGMYRNWFLDYASYVILERAVPHVQDGLKPVQRRVFGILWGIVREIVNGMFRVAIGIIVAIFSTIAFFGFILWLFTL